LVDGHKHQTDSEHENAQNDPDDELRFPFGSVEASTVHFSTVHIQTLVDEQRGKLQTEEMSLLLPLEVPTPTAQRETEVVVYPIFDQCFVDVEFVTLFVVFSLDTHVVRKTFDLPLFAEHFQLETPRVVAETTERRENGRFPIMSHLRTICTENIYNFEAS